MEISCKEIQNRHSCRIYDKNKVIIEEILVKIIKAASMAPSGKNLQPWKLRIIKDEDIIARLSLCLLNSKWIKNTNCIIAVYMDTREGYDLLKDAMAIGASIENMLLEAESNGISSCWIGEITNYEEEISRVIPIKENLRLMSFVVLGYEKRRFCPSPKKELKELLIE